MAPMLQSRRAQMQVHGFPCSRLEKRMLAVGILMVVCSCSSPPGGGGVDAPLNVEAGPSCVGNATGDLAGIPSATVNLLVQSELVVAGTVTTAGIRLDKVVWADSSTQDLATPFVGSDVPLQLTSPSPPVGSQQLVFAIVTYYDLNGHILELGELGHLDRAANASFESRIPAVVTMFAANPLYKRVASSDRVVSGTVTNVSATPETTNEHDPQLVATKIAVDKTSCGSIADVAYARFAASIDIAWYQAPKLALGQQAVFLLHYSDLDPAWSRLPQHLLLAVDPLDVQPTSELAAIEQLLAMPP